MADPARPRAVPVPTVADLEAIGAIPRPILRNLRITHAYHELSAAVAATIGPGANWCTFATWASRQAGQTIRGDDLGRTIEQVFAGSEAVPLVVGRLRDLRRALGRHIEADAVLRALREAWAPLLVVARVADAVARGNAKVFDEIGRTSSRTSSAPGTRTPRCSGRRSPPISSAGSWPVTSPTEPCSYFASHVFQKYIRGAVRKSPRSSRRATSSVK